MMNIGFGPAAGNWRTPALIKGGGRTALQILQSKGAAFFLHDFVGRVDMAFQEGVGPTPADDATEPIGLALGQDQSGSQSLATTLAALTEKLANPSFDAGIANWNASGAITLSADAGTLRAVGGGSGTAPYSDGFAVTAGDTIRVALRIKGDSAYSTLKVILRRAGNLATAVSSQEDISVGTGYTDVVLYLLALSTQADACVFVRFGGTEAVNIDSASAKIIPGNHALQSVSTSFRPLRQADGSIKADRLDDSLLQTLTSSGSMFMAAALLGASTPAAVAAIMGGPIGTNRSYLARDAAGKLCAGVGANGPATIVGGSDIAGLKGVAMLNIDAAGNVDLEWMPKGGDLASLYSAPISGSVAAGTAMRLFATNAGGIAGNYGGDSLYLASAIKTTLTASERRAFAIDWNGRIPA